jgi:hypothetical protein
MEADDLATYTEYLKNVRNGMAVEYGLTRYGGYGEGLRSSLEHIKYF